MSSFFVYIMCLFQTFYFVIVHIASAIQNVITRFAVFVFLSSFSYILQRGAIVSEPAIQVRRKGKSTQVWTIEKLENKLIDMRELYQEWKEKIPEVKGTKCQGALVALKGQNISDLAIRTGEGNDSPLHCSCLENFMDGGAWRATVHGVTKSQTRLSDWHTVVRTHTRASLNICNDAWDIYIRNIKWKWSWKVSWMGHKICDPHADRN